MTTMSVDQATARLDTVSQTGILSMSPSAKLGFLAKSLEELGLDCGYLSPAHNLASRARDLQRRVVEQQQHAAKDRGDAVRRLVIDPTAALDDVATVWRESSPWLDAPAGQRAPAAQLAHDASRMIEAQIDGQIASCGEQIFVELQRKAHAVVAEVAALPPLPKSVWVSAAPHEDLGRIPQHRSTWGVLAAANLDFESVHRIAEVVRDNIGAGPDSLPDGAPRWALVFKNWRPLLNDLDFNMLKKPLRLRRAIEAGYQPGLWRPEDIKTKPEDQTAMAKLRNFGSAVFGSPAPAG